MKRLVISAGLLLFSHGSSAVQRIAILNFELSDITSLPNTAEEQQRTASLRPLLAQALQPMADYEIITINAQIEANANASVGYLFNFDDLAAKLGKQAGADWIIVGRHSKPSFLYSYLLAHLVQVKNPSAVARFAIELKGNHQKVTQRGINKLADKIQLAINNSADE